MAAIEDESLLKRSFYLDGPGGSGKTFLYNTLMSVLRGRGHDVFPVASTGIAANLFKGGRTYHSGFKLPVPLLETSSSSMRGCSAEAQFLRGVKLIIWDEASMTPAHALDAVDRLLKELMGNDRPFGGKVLLLGGDFRQTLPVLRHGHRVSIVQSCLKYSPLWSDISKLELSTNMRILPEESEFADCLIHLGYGALPTIEEFGEDVIEIPPEHMCQGSLVEDIFGTEITIDNVRGYADRAILCPRNEDTISISEEVFIRSFGGSDV
jgi:hypothetical protein